MLSALSIASRSVRPSLGRAFYSAQASKVAIIGSGPSAHTAAIYTARANLEPVMYEGFMAGGVSAGGQLTTTTDVENFPGFPQGVNGFELMHMMRQQSERFGTKIVTETVSRVDLSKRPFALFTEGADGPDAEPALLADTLIIATGATARRMNLPGEEEYWQKGISACAVCDGALPMFRKKVLAVVGGGDSACEEANFLSKYAEKVYMLVRRDKMRASAVMQERVLRNPKVEVVWNTKPVSAHGDDKRLTHVMVDTQGEVRQLDVAGLFYAIGHDPNTKFLGGQINLDQDGYVTLAEPGVSTATNVEGVFACGDVVDKRYRQAITAAGTGCMAALDAEHLISSST
ncbi:thioredoxin reductase (NADPH) [Fonticula alba]|uniref:Thioredoxin reductase n=1 Tax=Fonticula alba TaxID=691883 RepID=A0A058ZCJ9_FONAL|nr:thioredoxin reductase (NADPH) [Fonticula alba]KCV71666.1 thioredoxin reductase (NADPH) [Fonticula alba]|eukprot:XP_009493244.1 thioredoxin reductase (NADPH) [Fonticula alba]